ncbi:MAG: tRNA (N6-isopentenyl adenosine(37)-C2)-methylthiotransferase MiaB [Lachnospiraceae bacterium]|nr:tRNA (N6-isopentenyl adenosine(37)-C2)-methylthiotransferase MiaB [Lachnospiraceae bacterium]
MSVNSESSRQLEFMEKVREHNKGRALKYCSVVFGCQMNEKDSEKLSGMLEKMGYERTESEAEADLIIYNTCTVRENADKRLYGRLGVAKQYKKDRPGLIICLCGCMMQEEHVVEKINTSYPYVDLIFGTHNIFKFSELLFTVLETGDRVIDIWEKTDEIVEDLPSRRKYPFKSGVNIMFGCDNFCSYCIVPYVRGRERSRKREDIINEIKSLASDGVVEVMLLGQNVNSYGKGLDEEISFARLLDEAANIDGIGRVRFMTSHPKDLSEELIDTIRDNPVIARHIHLPLQSGSDRLLSLMNRHYTKDDYLRLADALRTKIPDISITTDIITGFPTEEERDVEDTIDVIKKVRFDGAFTFEYSKRTGTKAASMEGQLPKETVQRYFDEVLKKVQDISKEQAKRFEGRIMEVLVEGINEKDPSMLTGRISQNNVVHFKNCGIPVGSFAKIMLDETMGFYYNGTVWGH